MLAFHAASLSQVLNDGRFFGKVLDEWIGDTQEFIRLKLPHLLVAALDIAPAVFLSLVRADVTAAERSGDAADLSELEESLEE